MNIFEREWDKSLDEWFCEVYDQMNDVNKISIRILAREMFHKGEKQGQQEVSEIIERELIKYKNPNFGNQRNLANGV